MFQPQYGGMQTPGMGQQYGSYGATSGAAMMQGGLQSNQAVMMQGSAPAAMFAGQQQGFGQPRQPQPDYRGMAQNNRPQYLQQAPNVTMNTNMANMASMGAQGGPAPPYSRPAQTMQATVAGVQQAQQNQFQQQQRMRQQMLAMQQQQQQQQAGPQGVQPSPALVAHLQRQMNPNPYQHQPPPYNM